MKFKTNHIHLIPPIVRPILLLVIIILIAGVDLNAQCPMCRIAAESNLEHGGTAGKGLNTGILYMLMLPYALVGFLGYIWYKNRRLET